MHLYEERGTRLVESLLGMFAFAIWDLRRGRVLLGRDRLGLKPLFFTVNESRLLFGSEIKALLAFPDCPRAVDWDALLGDPMLTDAADFRQRPLYSGFTGIEYLPGGALLEVDVATGTTRQRQYWELPEPDASIAVPEIVEEYGRLLLDAIDRCLTGETAIGLLLSGGVDSGVIAGRAARVTPIHTVTALAESTRANGDAAGALAIAESLGLPHSQAICDEESLLGATNAWKDMLWRCETPLCGPEQLLKGQALKVARTTVADLKVMLSGTGADEFAGGYSTTYARGPDASWPDFLAALRRQRDRAERRSHPAAEAWEEYLGAGLLVTDSTPRDVYAAYLDRKRRDLMMYNLWSDDRLASAQGIEARAPYLDHRLVELLARIAPASRPELLWDKWIVRAAGRGLLPAELLRRPKVPFFQGVGERSAYEPFARMLAADDCALVYEAFSSAQASSRVDATAVARDVEAMLRSDSILPARVRMILRLVNIGLLEQLAADGHECSEGAAAPQLLIDEWSDAGQVQTARTAAAPPVGALALAVPAFGSGALLVRTEPDPVRHFLVLRGSIRAELRADDPWLRVLQSIDGVQTLGSLCSAAGLALDDAGPYVETALAAGILKLVGAPSIAADGAGV